MEGIALSGNDSELVLPWPLTRQSLFTDSVVNIQSNVAILRYFQALSSNPVVLHTPLRGPSILVSEILEQLALQDIPPTSALERLLFFALQPEYLGQLSDSRFIPMCINHLENYCQRNEVRYQYYIVS